MSFKLREWSLNNHLTAGCKHQKYIESDNLYQRITVMIYVLRFIIYSL